LGFSVIERIEEFYAVLPLRVIADGFVFFRVSNERGSRIEVVGGITALDLDEAEALGAVPVHRPAPIMNRSLAHAPLRDVL
jgi:hypothetical protein